MQKKINFGLIAGSLALAFLLIRCAPDFNNPLDPENPNRLLAPDAPSSLLATAVTESTATFSWQHTFTGEEKIFVERKVPGSGFVQVDSLPGNASSYTDDSLSSKTQYTYQIKLGNRAGASYSPELSLTTLNFKPFFEFTGITVSTDGKITLLWRDRDPDDDAIIEFFYDTASTWSAGSPKIDDVSENLKDQYEWKYDGTFKGGRPGHLFARISDGRDTLWVTAPYAFTLPELAYYLGFTDPKPGATLGIPSVALNGTLNSASGIDVFQIDRENVILYNASKWSKTVVLKEGRNFFQFVINVKGFTTTYFDSLVLYYVPGMADSTPPVLTVDEPKNGDTLSLQQVHVSGTVYDAFSGVAYVTINGNFTAAVSGNQWSGLIPLDGLPGPQAITVTARDKSPAANEAQESRVIVYSPASQDGTPPTLRITRPQNNEVMLSPSVIVEGVALDQSGILSVRVGGDSLIPGGQGIWSTSVSLDSGKNTLRVTAVDNSPWRNQVTDSIILWFDPLAQDTQAPQIHIDEPANNTEFASLTNITLRGTAYDNAGIDSVHVNGKPAAFTSVDGKWQVGVSFPGILPGGYAFYAVATDIHGFQATDQVVLVYNPLAVDLTPPSLTLLSPAHGTTVSADTIAVKVRALDIQSGIDSVIIKGVRALPAGVDIFEALIPLVKGPNPVPVRVVDKNGNPATANYNFYLDDKPPRIVPLSHADSQEVAAATALVQVRVTDSISAVGPVTIDGMAADSQGNGLYQKNVTLLSGQPKTIVVKAEDASAVKNRDSLRLTLTYKPGMVDALPPVISLLSPAANSIRLISPDTVRLSVNEPCSSLTIAGQAGIPDGANQYKGAVTLAAGPNAVTVIAVDQSPGANRDTLIFNLYYNPPIAQVTLNPAAAITASSVTLAWSKSALSDFESYRLYYAASAAAATPALGTLARRDTSRHDTSYTVTGLAEKRRYYFRVYVFDSFGDSAASNVMDTVTLNAPPLPVTLNPLTSLSASTLNLSWSQTTSADFQSYRVYYSTVSGVTVASLAGPVVSVKSSTTATLTGLSANTTYFVRLFVHDSTGDTAGSAERSGITQSPPDSANPVISNISPVTGSQSPSPNLTVQVTATDSSGVDSVWIKGVAATPQSSNVWLASIPLLPGPNPVSIVAVDKSPARNRDSVGVSYTYDSTLLDKTGPLLSNISPVSGTEFSTANVTVSLVASDPGSGIKTITILGTAASPWSGSEWRASMTLVEGLNSGSIVADDFAGNQTTLGYSLTFTPPDLTNPIVSITAPPDGIWTGASPVNVQVSASDAGGSGLKSVKINNTDVSATHVLDVDLQEGANLILATAEDVAGNTDSESITVHYDATNPSVSITSHSNGQWVGSSPISVTVSPSDAAGGSGVKTVRIAGGNATGTNALDVALLPGSNAIQAEVWDNVDRYGTSSITVKYDPIDPVAAILSPVNTQTVYTASVTVLVSAVDNESGVESVVINGVVASWNGTEWQASVTLDVEGYNAITAVVTDKAGRQYIPQINVILDLPSVVSPLPGGSVLAATIAPACAVGYAYFYADGTARGIHASVTDYSHNWYMPTQAGIGNSYWIRATLTQGFTPTYGTLNTWVPLASTVSWRNNACNGSIVYSELLIQIATDPAGANIVTSGSYYIECESAQ